MQSACSRDGSSWLRSRPFLKNQRSTVSEESKVLDVEDFGFLFFVLLDFDVFARVHGKEKGKNCELGDGTL